MHVIDSSAVLDILLGRANLEILNNDDFAVPHLIDSEVLHALRRLERSGRLTPIIARDALDSFGDLTLERYAVDQLVPRIWELRHNLTAYDATFVALAEALDATSLLTADVRLARAVGVSCAIELV